MTKRNKRITIAATALMMLGSTTTALAQQIKGSVVDKNSHETLIGAVVTVEGSKLKAITDIDGNFQLNGLKKGTYTLYINYVGYKPQRIDGVRVTDAAAEDALSIAMLPDEQQLKEVVVTAVDRHHPKLSDRQSYHREIAIGRISCRLLGRLHNRQYERNTY